MNAPMMTLGLNPDYSKNDLKRGELTPTRRLNLFLCRTAQSATGRVTSYLFFFFSFLFVQDWSHVMGVPFFQPRVTPLSVT
jgi:hypothetical protein